MPLTKKIRVLIYCFFIGLIFTKPVVAQTGPAFQIESTNSRLNDSVYFLNSVFKIQLPDYILNAVDQGFELPLALEIEVYERRRLWFDSRVVYIKQQYVVHYHSLLDAYSIFDVNAGQRMYFNNMSEVNSKLSVLLNFPMLDNNNLVREAAYRARLRFGIDASELPTPLKSSSLWKNNWDIKSDWYEWNLNP